MAKLTGRPLIDVCDVNSFVPGTEVEISAGDTADFYFQLVDTQQLTVGHGYVPAGLRYMPAVGATLAVTFLNLDSAKQFARSATQPFPQDPSIWKVSILASDPLTGTVSMKFTLNEGTVTRTGLMQAVLLVSGINEIC